jgi:hypothetical protein
MSRDFVRHWQSSSAGLKRFAASPVSYPLITLLIGALTYLYAAPWLGYFWDDWEVVFLLHSRNAQLFTEYFAFDRPFAWPYLVMHSLVGLNPLAWHIATYLVRWGGILLLYYSFLQVWPLHARYLRWIGMLVLVYPGYLQQSISGAYNRHFTAFLIYGLSIYLMMLGTRKVRLAWLLAAASWVAAFVHVFTIEYFVGLELARPLLLWLLFRSRDGQNHSQALRRAFFVGLPYLLILCFYVWWRLVIFPSTIPNANYAGDFKLLQDFDVSVLSGALAVLTRAFLDLVHATLQVWFTFLADPDAWTLQAKISWLAFGLGAGLAILFGHLDAAGAETQKPASRSTASLLGFGLWAFAVSGLPIWLTSKQLSAQGRWDDRFALALMIPACIIVVALVVIVIRSRWQRLLLALLLALSVSAQVLVVNRYRLDWVTQNQYYWQLHWRAPVLAPGTAVISFEQPSASVPGYDASFAMNILFDGDADGGNMPYWFFTNDRFLNFELRPEKAISFKDRNLRFKGNTSDAIALIHQGENRCLQVLDSVYADQPFYGANQEVLVGISSTSRISAAATTSPQSDVFGAEPTRSWCYYFQKADLARQLGGWNEILRLEREARQLGYSSRFGPELLPFIEAHAQTGDWEAALDISREAQAIVSEMEPLLCSTWARLAQLGSTDAAIVQSARQAFNCEGP